MRIYRVQNIKDGRGPHRPGFTEVWAAPDKTFFPPAFYEEFPGIKESMQARAEMGMVVGCGFRHMGQLRNYFLPSEIGRLKALGYWVASMRVDELLAESKHQVVFARQWPLTKKVRAAI